MGSATPTISSGWPPTTTCSTPVRAVAASTAGTATGRGRGQVSGGRGQVSGPGRAVLLPLLLLLLLPPLRAPLYHCSPCTADRMPSVSVYSCSPKAMAGMAEEQKMKVAAASTLRCRVAEDSTVCVHTI